MKNKTLGIVCMLLALGFCLILSSGSTAGIRVATGYVQIIIDRYKAEKERYVCGVNTALRFEDRGEGVCHWNDRDTTKDNRWQILGTKIKGSRGGYLAYDLTGKDSEVFLTRDPMKKGVGSDWKVESLQDERQMHYHRIRAISGEVKGRELDIQEYEKKGEDGKTTTAYRLILRKGDARSRVDIKNLLTDQPTRN